MRIRSLNVGLPRNVSFHGKSVKTSIFKSPVEGRRRVTRLNIEGDEQSDLTVHGGVDKAVYCYPSEHYDFWRRELPGVPLPWGAFGENLTTDGLLEGAAHVGDRLRAGSAEFVVTQPRLPCYKLGVRFDRPDILKTFLESRRIGFYLSVAVEGEVGAGDEIVLVSSDEERLGVMDVLELYLAPEPDRELLRRASEHPSLPESWRDHFRSQLEELDDDSGSAG
ncbi:MAG TPA: MOSC domain-containing protein [Thermoanaerobaculia bacterium]|jgi:MOSC domain-containing protein YiiM|nr:MOSC domain-containing protein [Thermoanaerobaculia bacterium]